jgi:hypothetical protein
VSGLAVSSLVPRSPGLADRVRVASSLTMTPADRVVGRVLPVLAELSELLPWGGLRRGSAVAVRGSTSLLLALLAAATAAGSWAAVVGLPNLGLVAAAEVGVAVPRLALVPRPGAELAAVVAALLDGVDLVAVAEPGRLDAATVRRLSARARQRGAVLLPLGSWPGADLEIACTSWRWRGLGDGHGHLREREVVVRAHGRGSAARPRVVRLMLPGRGGGVRPAPDTLPADLSGQAGVVAPAVGLTREVAEGAPGWPDAVAARGEAG